jgi:hypothetical protein
MNKVEENSKMSKSLVGALLLVGLVGCQVEGDEPGLEGQASALSTSAGSLRELGDGQLEFRVTLPSGQRYVEVFARQNGIQNVALAIQDRGVENGDGTTTYAFARPGYAAGDRVEYRFYSYLPDSPGVFTPGPIEWKWYERALTPQSTVLPVTKDAAVIYASLGVGPAAGRNFGSEQSVDIGEYHLTSEGLFGYALAGAVPAGATLTGAELVIPAPYAPGGPTVTLRLNKVVSAWSESTVTWNTRPAYQLIREITLKSGVENRVDVTDVVRAALAAGEGEVSLALQPSPSASTTDNVFIGSKENTQGRPTSLALQWQ